MLEENPATTLLDADNWGLGGGVVTQLGKKFGSHHTSGKAGGMYCNFDLFSCYFVAIFGLSRSRTLKTPMDSHQDHCWEY